MSSLARFPSLPAASPLTTPQPGSTWGDAAQRIGWPSYVYPTLGGADGNYWDAALRYAPTVSIAIANASNGPGSSVVADYETAIAKAQAAGVTVLGYVDTGYAGTYDSRTTAAVIADIDMWAALYPTVDGFFFDRVSPSAGDLAYYRTVHHHVKSRHADGANLVVLNPGTATDEGYMSVADIIMTSEGAPAAYRSRSAAAWEADYPAHRFWHVVHSIGSIDEMREMVGLSRAYRAGYVYFTGDTGANPYDTVPANPFWSEQVDAVAAPTGAVVGSGWPTVHADNPPAGLSRVVFDDTTDNAAALQALLDHVKDTYGRGRVVVSNPNTAGLAFKINSAVTIPTKVQLWSDENTLCSATSITSGPAFIVADADFTPIVGLRMDGGLFEPDSGDLSSTYTGIQITGNGLKFEKLHLQYFGRGVDTSTSDTFGVVFEDCYVQHCAVGWYSDLITSEATNSGERNTWHRGAIANNVLGVWGSAGGQHLRLESTSLDFNTVAGKFDNCKVFLQGVHLEMSASEGVDYCFEVTVNTQFNVCQLEGVLGTGLYKMFRNDGGSTYAPWNTGFGQARWKQAQVYYTDQSSSAGTKTSEHEFTFPSSTTTTTIHFPFPGQWCAPTAKFLASHDGLYITPLSTTNGTYTLTASASSGSNRQCRIDFG